MMKFLDLPCFERWAIHTTNEWVLSEIIQKNSHQDGPKDLGQLGESLEASSKEQPGAALTKEEAEKIQKELKDAVDIRRKMWKYGAISIALTVVVAVSAIFMVISGMPFLLVGASLMAGFSSLGILVLISPIPYCAVTTYRERKKFWKTLEDAKHLFDHLYKPKEGAFITLKPVNE